MGKETPANPGRFERRQDIVEPVIPGPSKHREPLVEIPPPYHIEVHEENTSDVPAFGNALSSSASTGGELRRPGGGDDGGESGDDTHEREWKRELARRAG